MINNYCLDHPEISEGIIEDIDFYVSYESQDDKTCLKDIILSTCSCKESDYLLYFFRNKVEFLSDCNYFILKFL